MAKILLIEPDIILGRIYSSMFRDEGHTISLCHNAQEAVVSAGHSQPDIIVLELQLRGHSGIEFLYEFRSYEEWQSIPVILNTLIPPESLASQKFVFQDLGIANCLYKSVTNLKQLAQAIEYVLQPV